MDRVLGLANGRIEPGLIKIMKKLGKTLLTVS